MNNQQRKKKPATNAYSCFAREFMSGQKKNYSMEEAINAAKPFWDKMSEAEKAKYKEKAQHQKTGYKGNVMKYTSQGVSFAYLDYKDKSRQDAQDAMENNIEELLKNAYMDDRIIYKEFFFISSSFFCQTIEGDIFPAELAMLKWSLSAGVINSLNIYVNPGALPLGFSNEAKTISDSSHKLPIPPNALGQTNYYEIKKLMLNFMKNGADDSMPNLFCHTKEIRTTKMIVNKILNESDSTLRLNIYDLDQLLFRLKKYTLMAAGFDKKISSAGNLLICRDLIDKDRYDYTVGIGCKTHDDLDASLHCCLSIVKRWAFTFFDHCLIDELRVKKIAGKHYPSGTDRQDQENIPTPLVQLDDKVGRIPWDDDVSSISKRISRIRIPKYIPDFDTASVASTSTATTTATNFSRMKHLRNVPNDLNCTGFGAGRGQPIVPPVEDLREPIPKYVPPPVEDEDPCKPIPKYVP